MTATTGDRMVIARVVMRSRSVPCEHGETMIVRFVRVVMKIACRARLAMTTGLCGFVATKIVRLEHVVMTTVQCAASAIARWTTVRCVPVATKIVRRVRAATTTVPCVRIATTKCARRERRVMTNGRPVLAAMTTARHALVATTTVLAVAVTVTVRPCR